MAYCTETDILLQIDESQLENLTAGDNANLLTDIINYVSALMDGMLSKMYAVPLVNCPIIKDICVKLVICRLFERRGISGTGQADSVNNTFCTNANNTFNDIINGKIAIMDSNGSIIETKQSPLMLQIETDGQVFTTDVLDNFVN
jgi:phage gp36-like protein